jgi:hypothetical protein
MLKDVTLGQFFPATPWSTGWTRAPSSFWVIVYIVALFNAYDWYSYGSGAGGDRGSLRGGIAHKAKDHHAGLKPLIIVIVLTAC